MNKTKKSHPTRVFIPRFQYLPILRWLRLIRSIGRLVFWRRLDSKDSASIHRCCRVPPHSLFTHRGSRVSSTWFLRVCSRRIIPATRSERRGSRTNRFPAGMEQLGDRTNRITCWTTKRTDYIIVYSVTDILENFSLFPLFLPNSETENVGHGPMLVDTYRSL